MAFVITKPIAEHTQNYTLQVNKLAGDKILATYPFYLQHNISRDPSSLEATTMFTWIDDVRALAQTAKASINTATSIVEIRSAISDLTTVINTF